MLPSSSGTALTRVQLAVAIASLASVALVLRAALAASFATDEYTYAHAAWAIAHGQQPFRDFFLHHFPLSMQLGSLVFRLSDAPNAIAALRWLMVPLWLASVGFVLLLNRRHGVWAALFVPPLLASLFKWVEFGTQFRPDPTALTFFLASLWLVSRAGEGRRARGATFGAGVCYVLAVWSSQKVIIYGIALPLAWLLAVVQARLTPQAPRLVREPWLLALGVLVATLPLVVYLTVTANWAPLYKWCFQWGLVHETRYPPRDKLASFAGTLHEDGELLVLGLLGIVSCLVRFRRRALAATLADPDLLLVVSAVATTGSYFMQNAPYGWSLVAPLTFVALFAARCLADVIALAHQRSAQRSVHVLSLLVCIAVAFQNVPLHPRRLSINTRPRAEQDALLASVARLTAPTDAIYDNTGSYVARPHAHYFFFTDKAARVVLADRLVREIPAAITEKGVSVFLEDGRSRQLPGPLRAYLDLNFLPILPSLRVWGRTYATLLRGMPQAFEAVRADDYYVMPKTALNGRKLFVDGWPVKRQLFHLDKGEHAVTWRGLGTAPTFSLLWLPRDRNLRAPLTSAR